MTTQAEAKAVFYSMKSKLEKKKSPSDYHRQQRLHSLVQMYRCMILKHKYNKTIKQCAEYLGIKENRVYELLRGYEMEKAKLEWHTNNSNKL